MSNGKFLRARLMARAHEVLDAYIDAATGIAGFNHLSDGEARREVWNLIAKTIEKTDDPILTNLSSESTQTNINNVLYQVSTGNITPDEASKLMKLIVDGYQVTSIEETLEKLKEAGLLK